MKIAYLLFDPHPASASLRAAIAQTAMLADRHDVELWLVGSSRAGSLLARAPVRSLPLVTTGRRGGAPHVRDGWVQDGKLEALHARPSRHVPAGWSSLSSGLVDAAVRRQLEQSRPDVVVTSSAEALALASSLSPAQVRVVHLERMARRGREKAFESLRFYGPRAHAVVALDHCSAAHIDALTAGATNVAVIADPLPPDYLPQSRLESPVFLLASRLGPDQRVRQCVRAFGLIAEDLPAWRLRILGEGSQRRDLLGEARRLRLFDRVELPGTSEDMAAEWAKASVAVSTSFGEGAPYSLVEASAAGVPVVTYDSPEGARHVVSDGVNGLLVAPDSPVALASAMHSLAADAELRHRLGSQAREMAQRHAPATVADDWDAILFDHPVPVETTGGAVAIAPAPAPASSGPLVDERTTPADAHRHVMRLATEAAQAQATGWVALPPAGDDPPILIIPAQRRTAFLNQLTNSAPPDLVVRPLTEPGGLSDPGGRLDDCAAELVRGRAAAFALSPPVEVDGSATIYASGCDVAVEFWELTPGGSLVAPRLNRWVTELPRDFARGRRTIAGLEVDTPVHCSGVSMFDRPFDVDVVLTWVDGDDPEWQRERDERLRSGGMMSQTRASSGRARFTSRDELRYAMRSIHLFAPWVRHVHLVTSGQVPHWLDTDHPSVTLVSHHEIFDADHLPTFNSHAIEARLRLVPGLADHFVYFNDDVMLGRPVGPAKFFSSSGQFAAFLGNHPIGVPQPDAKPYRRAGFNNRRLLETALNRTITHELAHTPHPFRRSTLDHLAERFPEVMKATAAAPFRSETDISVTSSLAQHYGLFTGEAYPASLEHKTVMLGDSRLEQVLDVIARDRPLDAFCLADDHDLASAPSRVNEVVYGFLERYFPIPAPWERAT